MSFSGKSAVAGFALCMIVCLAFPLVASAVEMTMWVNSWPQAGVDAIQRAADLFAERHPEVTSVTVIAVPQGEHMERLTVAVLGESPPDVVALAAPFAQPALARLLLPLNRYIDQSDVIDRADYPPFMLASLGFGGEEYGVPAIEAALGLLLVYNKDLFRQAGLPDRGPESLEELYEWHRT